MKISVESGINHVTVIRGFNIVPGLQSLELENQEAVKSFKEDHYLKSYNGKIAVIDYNNEDVKEAEKENIDLFTKSKKKSK
jgi:hypothetical protein